ncbi:alpha-L-rhamnosidase C-terminal domain-containing protein [Kutzneria sp. 744]|uniref:alpha-L-rhamnosidase C-terminal domain-containing protein n=1 Tax=Kutzneria sp. (strain 744) TaxID=345341 RepID=UPI000A02F045
MVRRRLHHPAQHAARGGGGVNQLPLILDGAKRDRNVWIGDINIEGPTVYDSLGANGNDYLKQSIRLLGSYQLSSGFVTGCLAPQSPVHTGPPIPGTTACYSTSYSMYFTPDLADYYRATGDLAFARQEFPIVQRELAWNASRVNSLGLLVTDTSDGQDWDWYDGIKTGAVTEYNALYYLNLIEGAYLARETGQADLATQYTNKAAALRTAINTNLFNSRTGVYDLSDKVRGTVAQDANADAVLFGVAPAGAGPGILAKLKSALWGTHGPRPFTGTGYSTLISPFVSGYELRARLAAGDDTGAMQLLSDVWGQMVTPGPDFTGAMWENLNSDGSIQKGSTSLAHGWSSGPTSALTGYVLGARPVGAGYATWIVQPQPGSLSWTVGQVPTPHGPLAVKWGRASGGEFDVDVTAPDGTSGAIAVPASGPNTAITVNGTTVWDHGTFSAGAGVTSADSDGSYVYLSVSASGDYRVAAR